VLDLPVSVGARPRLARVVWRAHGVGRLVLHRLPGGLRGVRLGVLVLCGQRVWRTAGVSARRLPVYLAATVARRASRLVRRRLLLEHVVFHRMRGWIHIERSAVYVLGDWR
jgi:hypothetical protein